MKKLLTTTILAAAALSFVASANVATASPHFDYAKEYCKFYKNKAKWNHSQYWWDRYYRCLEEYK